MGETAIEIKSADGNQRLLMSNARLIDPTDGVPISEHQVTLTLQNVTSRVSCALPIVREEWDESKSLWEGEPQRPRIQVRDELFREMLREKLPGRRVVFKGREWEE